MVSVLSRVAPKEVPPTLEQFQGWWEQAYCRYEQIRRVLLLVKTRRRPVRRESRWNNGSLGDINGTVLFSPNPGFQNYFLGR